MNKAPSKSLEGFNESTPSSSRINRAVAFTCSKQDKVLTRSGNQLLEESLSQVTDLDWRNEITKYDIGNVAFDALVHF